MLPTGAKPVTSYEDQEEALLDVVIGIARIGREIILHGSDPSLKKPIPIADIYLPSWVGNKGVASFLLNGQEHILYYTRIDGIRKFLDQRKFDNLRYQTILLTYNQEELVREEVPELPNFRTLVKQHKFQIEEVDCLFTFKKNALGIMSVRIEVGGIVVFSH
jgi:hypothetical protein